MLEHDENGEGAVAGARFEQFVIGAMPAEQLWAVVGDLRRLPEWTDLAAVDGAPTEPVLGATFTAVTDGRLTSWRIVTVERKLLEISSEQEGATTGLGWRVVAAAGGGSRLIIAGAVERGGRGGGLRARTVDLPALRRRADRWVHTALEVAADPG